MTRHETAFSPDTPPGGVWGAGPSPRYEALAALFRPVFARIAEGAAAREAARRLPFEEIGWLKEVRFGALRVPEAQGGFGATLPELSALLVELAAADSNLPQILRAHFGVVENVLASPDEEHRKRWFARLAAGDVFGGAFTEHGKAKAGTFATTILPDGDEWVVEGEKYYSTGSLFSDWIEVLGTGPDEEFYVAIVPVTAEGVTQADDWDGFGQRLTGSGSSAYGKVRVPAENVAAATGRFRYQAAYYQLAHLATLTGIARAAAGEVTREVARRTRTYSHAAARVAREDPQLLQVVGRVHAAAYAAGAITARVAEAVGRAYAAAIDGGEDEIAAANLAAEIEAAEGQVVVARLVLDAATVLFDALGASATGSALNLDRHWRNARTISSHNPLVYKERVIGDFAVNGAEPPYLWLPGES